MNANISHVVYLKFANQNPSWLLIVDAVLLNLVAIFGIVTNIGLIYITIRSNSLKGTANYLLALYSLFEVLHQHGHFLFLFTALRGPSPFISYDLAVRICTVPLLAMGAIGPVMAFIAFDRLLNVVWPTMSIRKCPYLALITLFCFGSGLFNVAIFYRSLGTNDHLKVTGSISDLLQGDFAQSSAFFLTTFYVLTIVIYILVAVLVRYRSKSAVPHNAELIGNRIMRSISIIIGVNLGGYFSYAAFYTIIAPKIGEPILVWAILQALALLLNLSSASSATILYFTSHEYRKNFEKYLPLRLLKCHSANNSIHPSYSNNNIQLQIVNLAGQK